jgi:hypothetical protein
MWHPRPSTAPRFPADAFARMTRLDTLRKGGRIAWCFEADSNDLAPDEPPTIRHVEWSDYVNVSQCRGDGDNRSSLRGCGNRLFDIGRISVDGLLSRRETSPAKPLARSARRLVRRWRAHRCTRLRFARGCFAAAQNGSTCSLNRADLNARQINPAYDIGAILYVLRSMHWV